MRRAILVALLGSSLSGCIVPPPFTTRSEIITAVDSAPIFGPRVELRLLNEVMTIAWDNAARGYTSAGTAGGNSPLGSLIRVARLKRDVYLLQAQLERSGAPLACEVREVAATALGVRFGAHEDGLELRGERAAIVRLLSAILDTCRPLLQIDNFVPSRAELVAGLSAPGLTSGGSCRACAQAGCIQGSVTDESGAAVEGVTVHAQPTSGAGETQTARTDEAGQFFLAGVSEGSYQLKVQNTVYALVWPRPFLVKPGFTYVFDSPFLLKVATVEESITVSIVPRQCSPSGPRKKL